MKQALDSNPDEVSVALSSDCPDERNAGNRKPNRLAAGVPVFDAVTEEMFGFVQIEADLDRLIESQLFGAGAGDVMPLIGAALTLLVVTVVASLAPARRATRVDPMAAMRTD